MGELGPFLVPISLFVSLAAVAIFRGPLGKALGERIAGRQLEGESTAEAANSGSDCPRSRSGSISPNGCWLSKAVRTHCRRRNNKCP